MLGKLDQMDLKIMKFLLRGFSQASIGRIVGLSQPAVHYRVNKIKSVTKGGSVVVSIKDSSLTFEVMV